MKDKRLAVFLLHAATAGLPFHLGNNAVCSKQVLFAIYYEQLLNSSLGDIVTETARDDLDIVDTADIPTVEEVSGPAYLVKAIPVPIRAVKIAAAMAVPISLALLFGRQSTERDSILELTWLPLVTLGIALWYCRNVWRAATVTVLATTRHRVQAVNAMPKVINATLALFVACVLVLYAQRDSIEPDKYFALAWPLVAYACYLGFLFFPQYSETFTPAAKAEFARLKYSKSQEEQKRQAKPVVPTWLDKAVAEVWAR